MVSRKEFEIIRTLLKKDVINQNIYEYMGKVISFDMFESFEEIVKVTSDLVKKGYIVNEKITDIAIKEIANLKVENAIILAAGGSDINEKSIYSRPKGLYVKNGETLIERQIRQLKEVGIEDITIVLGYKQEMYFFLEDKWGVTLEINPGYKKIIYYHYIRSLNIWEVLIFVIVTTILKKILFHSMNLNLIMRQ